jgi:peptidoglycan/xylan/chitin deacetylase (PgdA/CDA1 family)
MTGRAMRREPIHAILTYHSIDDSGSAISVDRKAFRRHVEWLAGSGIALVDLEQLPAVPAETDAAAVTFDDGFTNFAEQAWPVLADHGVPVTVFVPTGRVGGENDWNAAVRVRVPRLPLLGWDALGRLAEAGVVLGAHGVKHVDLRGCGDGELQDEVRSCGERIASETGRRANVFAYPFGAVDARVAAVVAEHYDTAYTTELRWLGKKDDPALLPRLDAFYLRAPGRLESWGTGSFRRLIRWRNGLRRARSLIAEGV